MDEKLIGLAAAVGAGTVLGRRLRPAARVAMKGVVALTEAGAGAAQGIAGMYNEAKAEYRADRTGAVAADSAPADAPPADAATARRTAAKPSPGVGDATAAGG